MAVRSYTLNRLGPRTFIVTWTGILNVDEGQPFDLSKYSRADLSVQVLGTTGVGGFIMPQISNDGATFAALSDFTAATFMQFNAAGMRDFPARPRFFKPVAGSGDGTTNFTCILNVAVDIPFTEP